MFLPNVAKPGVLFQLFQNLAESVSMRSFATLSPAQCQIERSCGWEPPYLAPLNRTRLPPKPRHLIVFQYAKEHQT